MNSKSCYCDARDSSVFSPILSCGQNSPHCLVHYSDTLLDQSILNKERPSEQNNRFSGYSVRSHTCARESERFLFTDADFKDSFQLLTSPSNVAAARTGTTWDGFMKTSSLYKEPKATAKAKIIQKFTYWHSNQHCTENISETVIALTFTINFVIWNVHVNYFLLRFLPASGEHSVKISRLKTINATIESKLVTVKTRILVDIFVTSAFLTWQR